MSPAFILSPPLCRVEERTVDVFADGCLLLWNRTQLLCCWWNWECCIIDRFSLFKIKQNQNTEITNLYYAFTFWIFLWKCVQYKRGADECDLKTINILSVTVKYWKKNEFVVWPIMCKDNKCKCLKGRTIGGSRNKDRRSVSALKHVAQFCPLFLISTFRWASGGSCTSSHLTSTPYWKLLPFTCFLLYLVCYLYFRQQCACIPLCT